MNPTKLFLISSEIQYRYLSGDLEGKPKCNVAKLSGLSPILVSKASEGLSKL